MSSIAVAAPVPSTTPIEKFPYANADPKFLSTFKISRFNEGFEGQAALKIGIRKDGSPLRFATISQIFAIEERWKLYGLTVADPFVWGLTDDANLAQSSAVSQNMQLSQPDENAHRVKLSHTYENDPFVFNLVYLSDIGKRGPQLTTPTHAIVSIRPRTGNPLIEQGTFNMLQGIIGFNKPHTQISNKAKISHTLYLAGGPRKLAPARASVGLSFIGANSVSLVQPVLYTDIDHTDRGAIVLSTESGNFVGMMYDFRLAQKMKDKGLSRPHFLFIAATDLVRDVEELFAKGLPKQPETSGKVMWLRPGSWPQRLYYCYRVNGGLSAPMKLNAPVDSGPLTFPGDDQSSSEVPELQAGADAFTFRLDFDREAHPSD